ncbi:MAG: DCC1-like thiol-disulfide oxidoreductase family protein [Gemmatimonadaceae bacterium]|jgi:predicted DCC family thiol-disulfide oxidoreductase YuxK|nr:DCC1-like thiol-disulfide oxidoreductase family protein [Gemmatimonadaceae bacterium]
MLHAAPLADHARDAASSAERELPVLLYDGECGLCANAVQFILRHEPPARRSALHFAPLDGVLGTQLAALHPVLADRGSVVWYEPRGAGSGHVVRRSDAALAVLAHLGGAWSVLGALLRWIPRALRDTVYDVIARRRFALAPRACLLPSPESRRRFLA